MIRRVLPTVRSGTQHKGFEVVSTVRSVGVTAVLTSAALATDPASASAVADNFLQPMGPVAQEQADHLLRVVGITMIVILPVLIGVPMILWRYRYAKPRGDYTPKWEFSGKLEWALWGVPVAVVVVLASWLWYSADKLDPYDPVGPELLRVQAIGVDWKWIFVYPDEGIATVNELAIPVGRPVELSLTTDTVMQSLLIAPLTGQIYAMPGMRTKLNFAASRPGVAEGENTQFNGNGFGRQKFAVRALTPAQYKTWVATSDDTLTLDQRTYAILRRQSVLADARGELGLSRTQDAVRMRLGERDVFDQVIAKYHRRSGSDTAAWGGTGKPATNPLDDRP